MADRPDGGPNASIREYEWLAVLMEKKSRANQVVWSIDGGQSCANQDV